jgi:hypothetical protein
MRPERAISTVGHYYLENEKKVLHCVNPLIEAHKGRIDSLSIGEDRSLKDLKKIVVVLKKGGEFQVPAALMMKIQVIYGECIRNAIRKDDNDPIAIRRELLSSIVSLLKIKGSLPKGETAVFSNGQREKFLWFISAAKIEREELQDPSQDEEEEVDRKLIPILFCEEREKGVPSLEEAALVIARGIQFFVRLRAHGNQGEDNASSDSEENLPRDW